MMTLIDKALWIIIVNILRVVMPRDKRCTNDNNILNGKTLTMVLIMIKLAINRHAADK